MNIFGIIYLDIIYFTDAVIKWSTIFRYSFFIGIVTAASPAVLLTDIFPLTSINASL